VLDIDGNDHTEEFLIGAEATLKIAKLLNVKGAIFMERSPSCGVNNIYDGSFNNILTTGKGITTILLEKKGFKVYSNNDINKIEIIRN
jgi:uncharacterized protein YbbK (DUF523 family)